MSYKNVIHGNFYYKKIAANIPISNEVIIACGKEAINISSRFNDIPPWLILPYPDSAILYKWPVSGAKIIIFDTSLCDDDYLNDLAYCLYTANASVVRCVLPDFSGFTFDKPI